MGYRILTISAQSNLRSRATTNELLLSAISATVANLTKPVLLLTASDDPIGTPAAAEGSTRPSAPDLQVQEIKSGHFVMLEKADEVNKAMSDFFAKV